MTSAVEMGTDPNLTLASLQQVLAVDPHREVKQFKVLQVTDSIGFIPPAPSDFILQEESSVSGEQAVNKVIQDPLCTLYCFDYTQRRALFVQTDPEVDLYAAPFLYLAQTQNVKKVITVPIELLEKVYLQTSTDSFLFNSATTSLRSEEDVVFLFSTGRCGSTLLCKVLGRIDGVLGVQEPNFTTLAGLSNTGGATEDEIITLLRLCLLCHCKPKIHKKGSIKNWIFKFQSQVTEYLGLFPRAFPKAHNLFMYRNAESTTKSIARLIPTLETELQPVGNWTAMFSGLKWISRDKKYQRDLCAIYWLTTMKKALECIKSGMNLRCLRYEELVAEPEKMIRGLANECSIELKDSNLPHVLAAMSGHSQEGVFTAYEHAGLDQVISTMHEFMLQGEIDNGNYILPVFLEVK